jgi:hypothetical protein
MRKTSRTPGKASPIHPPGARTEALQVRVEYVTDELRAMERTAEQACTLAQEAVQRAGAIKQ